jgi:choline dehydrogenase-like flavoprotein
MATPFQRPEETRRAYHSGLSGKVIAAEHVISAQQLGVAARKITFTTAKYVPPFDVTIRSNVTGWTVDHAGTFDAPSKSWLFNLPGNVFNDSFDFKFVLDKVFWMSGFNIEVGKHDGARYFGDFEIVFGYQVEFKTTDWQPNHLITLRNSDDGWWRDVFGEFRNGQWYFLLDRDVYSANLEAKLVLDQGLFMDGPNLAITSAKQLYQLPCPKIPITFQAAPSAFKHGYDNLTSVESPVEQSTVRSVGREGEVYDVIIIGSGMGGGTLADALSNRGAKVLVLEAGGLRLPAHMNELARSEINFVGRDQLGHFENKGNPYFQPGVHFNLGGRSVYWSGLIPRMRDWEFRGVWPAAVRDYLTLPSPAGVTGYERAERLVRKYVSLGKFQDDVRNHLNGALAPNLAAIDLPRSLHQPALREYKRSTGTFSTTELLLDSLGFTGQPGRDNLRVNLHYLTTKIETSGNTATAVVCQDLLGHVERKYEGKYIVLACGSVESPKLALNSTLNDPNSKMGIGLTDHPAYFYQIYHTLPQTGPYGWIGDPAEHAKIMIRHTAATSSAHAYNIELLINPRYWDARHADDELWNSREGNGTDSKVEIKFIFDSLLMDSNKVVATGIGHKPEVHVGANPWADAYKAEMVLIRNQILTELGVPAGALSTVWNWWEWSEGIYGTVHHAGGTLRMSDNNTGVVDETLKFQAYDNLYCCDVSVFPTIPAANPSLTLVALAQRLSDTLAAKLSLP